jgi:hypothetical protein
VSRSYIVSSQSSLRGSEVLQREVSVSIVMLEFDLLVVILHFAVKFQSISL